MPATSPVTCAVFAIGPTAPVMQRNSQPIINHTVPAVMVSPQFGW